MELVDKEEVTTKHYYSITLSESEYGLLKKALSAPADMEYNGIGLVEKDGTFRWCKLEVKA